MKIVIANSNPIHSPIEAICESRYQAIVIHSQDKLTYDLLEQVKPDFIFFLHWSFIIPANIYENYNCIVFHMTDLPYGRGGSPLQNLILKRHRETVISAIKVTKGLDTGDVFLKKPLSLDGTAVEIFMRAGQIMLQMIGDIIYGDLKPVQQTGKVVVFTRRTPQQSNLESVRDISGVYDFIRMLDAPGYPKAFVETMYLKFEFSQAQYENDEVIAQVKITKK